jgi:hypothetical protein
LDDFVHLAAARVELALKCRLRRRWRNHLHIEIKQTCERSLRVQKNKLLRVCVLVHEALSIRKRSYPCVQQLSRIRLHAQLRKDVSGLVEFQKIVREHERRRHAFWSLIDQVCALVLGLVREDVVKRLLVHLVLEVTKAFLPCCSFGSPTANCGISSTYSSASTFGSPASRSAHNSPDLHINKTALP